MATQSRRSRKRMTLMLSFRRKLGSSHWTDFRPFVKHARRPGVWNCSHCKPICAWCGKPTGFHHAVKHAAEIAAEELDKEKQDCGIRRGCVNRRRCPRRSDMPAKQPALPTDIIPRPEYSHKPRECKLVADNLDLRLPRLVVCSCSFWLPALSREAVTSLEVSRCVSHSVGC